MFPQHEITAIRLNDLYVEERLQEARTINLLRQTGFFGRFNLPLIGCKGLVCLGRLLIALGHRLERFESVPKTIYSSTQSSHTA